MRVAHTSLGRRVRVVLTLVVAAMGLMLLPTSAAAYTARGWDPNADGACPDEVTTTPHEQFQDNNTIMVSPPVLEIEANPGETVEQCLVLISRKNEPRAFRLEPFDAVPGKVSGMDTVEWGRWGVAGWLSLPVATVEVNPGDDVVVPYKIIVPQNPPIGTNHGGIRVRRDLEGAEAGTPGVALAMQIIVNIPGPVEHGLKVTTLDSPRYVEHGSFAKFRYGVENQGNVIDHFQQKLKFDSKLTGKTYSTVTGEDERVMRGGKRELELLWTDVPWIGYFQPTLVIKSDGGTQEFTYDPIWVFPPLKYLIALAVALLLPVLAAVYVWRKRRREWQQYVDEDWDDESAIGSGVGDDWTDYDA